MIPGLAQRWELFTMSIYIAYWKGRIFTTSFTRKDRTDRKVRNQDEKCAFLQGLNETRREPVGVKGVWPNGKAPDFGTVLGVDQEIYGSSPYILEIFCQN